MTALRFLLAVDNGSQSTKVQVIDQHGTVHAQAQRRLRPYAHPAPGHVVHPDDDLWDSVVSTSREAVDRFRGDPARIEAVGVCTIRFCRALLDGDGRLVEPVLSWMDERVGRPHEAVEGVRHVTTSSGYIGLRLTGERRDTAANYQGVWPIDQATFRWSEDPEDYARTGLDRASLFELVDPGERLGGLTSAAAGLLGLVPGTPVFATANDKAVEALGAGVGVGLDEGALMLSLGTYIAAMTTGRHIGGASDAYWVNFASTPRSYLYESGGIRRGMWTVSWVRDLLLPPGETHLTPDEAERLLGDEAAEVAPGCGGLMAVLDWLAPADAGYRRGALIGFDGSQQRAAVYRAVLEGIALTMARHVEAMERALDRTHDRVVVTGGGAKSATMMQILAAVLDRRVERPPVQDVAGLGAAICAAVGAGLHPGWREAVAAMVPPGESFAPDPATVEAYRPVRARYDRLLAGFDDLARDAFG